MMPQADAWKTELFSLGHAWSSGLISESLDISHQAWCVSPFLIVEAAKLSQFHLLAPEE